MATMLAAPVMTIEEYLLTPYDPDRDFVDGEVQERNVGEAYHSLVQMNLGGIFREHRKQWGLRPYPEYRVRVSATRVRIPDLCFVSMQDPLQPVLSKPPVLCIEVLSPEDRFRRTMQRVQDFLTMGVQTVWIINPYSRDIWTVEAGGEPRLHEEAVLTLAGTPVSIAVADVFEMIDEAPSQEQSEQ